ncbi:phosphodiester glycosidase family protein [Herbaspirillum rhizosphaerae]|uniref:phosphodiester glycosidase family protein n=1 Tax=Herbaspirillum rhizosphaerae TaxID=346179 RepID=UPI00067AC18E|nr:phosphodiester glycosidase family protein [Herbaspirillum rhizosphaerae]
MPLSFRQIANAAAASFILTTAIACALCSAPISTALAAELRQYRYQQTSISACYIDLQQDALRMYWKDPAGNIFGTFANLRAWLRPQGRDLTCATNAGIYDKEHKPLGLYIENGVTLRKLNTRQNAYGNFYLQPNGVFIVEEKRARIVDTASVDSDRSRWLSQALYATQSGPIMLRNGEINAAFDPGSVNLFVRNAVCIDPSQKVALVMARNPITFYDFALFLRDKLKCVDALYLDGNISRIYPSLEADIGPSFGAIIGVEK